MIWSADSEGPDQIARIRIFPKTLFSLAAAQKSYMNFRKEEKKLQATQTDVIIFCVCNEWRHEISVPQ